MIVDCGYLPPEFGCSCFGTIKFYLHSKSCHFVLGWYIKALSETALLIFLRPLKWDDTKWDFTFELSPKNKFFVNWQSSNSDWEENFYFLQSVMSLNLISLSIKYLTGCIHTVNSPCMTKRIYERPVVCGVCESVAAINSSFTSLTLSLLLSPPTLPLSACVRYTVQCTCCVRHDLSLLLPPPHTAHDHYHSQRV